MAAAEVLGTLTSQKEPFSHSDMSTIYIKSQWEFKITIELTFMDNIKTWKNIAKRMIDFLPVTWKCCFYSAHFQPGGMFDPIPIRNCCDLLGQRPGHLSIHLVCTESQPSLAKGWETLAINLPWDLVFWSNGDDSPGWFMKLCLLDFTCIYLFSQPSTSPY